MSSPKSALRLALRSLKIADHMTYVTYPLFDDFKMLVKIFEEIHTTLIQTLTAIVIHETQKSDISLFKNYAKSYDISHYQIKIISEMLALHKKHKESSMEFVRQGKIVILSDSLTTETINLKIIKEYLLLVKELFLKVCKKIA